MASDSSFDNMGATVISRIGIGLAAICVALRFYSRIRIKAGIGWDDWWILIGLLMTFLTGALLLWGVNVDRDAGKAISEAIDHHSIETFDISPHVTFLKLFFVCSILYFTLIMAIKVSILLMYRRIFFVDSPFRLHSLLLVVVVVAFWFSATVATIFYCRPFGYSWMGLELEEHCFDYNAFWMATGIIEVVIDIAILALPIRMVLQIQLTRKQRASVLFIFLLGSFVVITGLVRVIYGYILGRQGPSYSQAEFWSTVHIGMGIVCACLPTLRPVFTRTPYSITASSSSSSSVRRRYYHLRGWHSTVESISKRSFSTGSKVAHTVEVPSSESPQRDCRTDVTNPQTEKVWLRGDHSV